MSQAADSIVNVDTGRPEGCQLAGRWLPKHLYPAMALRCVLPSCSETQEVGLAFDSADGSMLRLRLSLNDARRLQAALADDHRVRGSSAE